MLPPTLGGNPRPISPGSTGKLDYIDDAGQFHVKWDNGCTLALVLGEDRFSVYLPEPQTFKLYMPLTADFYGRDEWGDMSEDGEEWDGHTLMDYEGQILSALVKNRVPEENESGLMRWYGEDDSVDHKVRSAVFTVEVRNRQLWGVAECRVAGELTPEELRRGGNHVLKRILRSRRGEGYIDVCVLVLCAMLVIALAVQVLPAFIAKQQLDTFATELVREAEIAGRIGPETDRREQALREQTGLDPEIEWSDTGRIQLNEEVTVTLTHEIDLGLFAGFGSFPITLRADATGKSEVYWK